jgi:hypothetical protein
LHPRERKYKESGRKCIRRSKICIPNEELICISFVGEPESKRSLGRPMRKWVDNI